MSDRCKSCQAPIRFVVMTTGGTMPLDYDPMPEGNIVIGEDGRGEVLSGGIFDATEGPRYRSHFVSCPASAKFRKRGKL